MTQFNDEILKRLDRIIELLEGKNDVRNVSDRKRNSLREKHLESGTDINRTAGSLIQAYCDAYKERYGTNPIIDGKTAGLAKYVLKTLSIERASELVQAYLQISDDWFLKRTHDFPTFVSNMSRVAVSLANGTEKPEDRNFWREVFMDIAVFGGVSTSGTRDLSTGSNPDAKVLGRSSISSGEDCALLASSSKRIGHDF